MPHPPVDRQAFKRALAYENWRRIETFWSWTGRNERDKRLLRVLTRYAPEAPSKALQRAQLGHPQGGGQLRRSSACAIVGPVFGVRYEGVTQRALRIADYAGPAPEALRAHLQTLHEDRQLDLAENWIDYLRHEQDQPPEPWQPEAACEVERKFDRASANPA
jgi:hypothetical protein